MAYEIRKTNHSRGAWRVVDTVTGAEIAFTDHWQRKGRWLSSEEPICGETKSECVALVLRLLAVAGDRIRALRSELAEAKEGGR
jgi:hypothetical protein